MVRLLLMVFIGLFAQLLDGSLGTSYILTIVPLFKSQPHGIIAWTMYVVQTIFQGAALPLLGYVSRGVGKLVQEMHDVIVKRVNERIDDIEEKVTQEHDELKALLNEIHKSKNF